MDEIKTDDAPVPARAIERVTLGPEEAEKINAMLRQIDESSKGFLQLSRSDVVNFLVRERKVDLSARELQQIRHHHYDPVRHLNWITPRLKDALGRNDIATVQALQAELRNIELSAVNATEMNKRERAHASDTEQTAPAARRRRKPKARDSVETAAEATPEPMTPIHPTGET